MKIVVFGAGAIGSVLGALLSKKHEVTLIGRGPHVEAVKKHGLTVVANEPMTVKLRAESRVNPDDRADLVLLTVKSYDTAKALEDLAPLMRPGSRLMTCQNGLGNWELASKRFPKNPA